MQSLVDALRSAVLRCLSPFSIGGYKFTGRQRLHQSMDFVNIEEDAVLLVGVLCYTMKGAFTSQATYFLLDQQGVAHWDPGIKLDFPLGSILQLVKRDGALVWEKIGQLDLVVALPANEG